MLSETNDLSVAEETMDPANWKAFQETAHRMLDDMLRYIQHSAERKVWQPVPEKVKAALSTSLPAKEKSIDEVYKNFSENILPYSLGNTHPRFWGWVCGTGSATGMLADMLASGMNATASFGDHAALYTEQQVLNWTKELYGFPQNSSGILTTGASLANILAIATARNHFNKNIRKEGIQHLSGQLVVYGSTETHSCLQKAAELLGIGSNHFKKIAVDEEYTINIDLLQAQIKEDKKNGLLPFCIIGNAGTVNTGSIDNLQALSIIARQEGLWFHVDGAFGAAPNILARYKKILMGLEQADSIAFDYHKWFYVNYDVGGVLFRDAQVHKDAFEIHASYLAHHERGVISGPLNFNHLGIELSRGFRALKVWMLMQEQGIEKYARLIQQNIEQAAYLAQLIIKEPSLELMAPVPLNIVCFRFTAAGFTNEQLNAITKEILMQLHESGIAVPSFTILKGCYVIRVAITNHRSTRKDFDLLVEKVITFGKAICLANGTFEKVNS